MQSADGPDVGMLGAHSQDFRVIPRLWRRLPPGWALDLGCGGGLYSKELASRGMTVVGLDASLEALRRGQGELRNSAIYWILGDARHLPFRDGVFQHAISVEVLTHLPPVDRQQTIDELSRTAVVDATVYLTLHNRARLTLSRWLHRQPRQSVYTTSNLDVWPTDPLEALGVMAKSGFRALRPARYLNFHSRFSERFVEDYPMVSRLIAAAEWALSRTFLLRRCAITFLLILRRGELGRGGE